MRDWKTEVRRRLVDRRLDPTLHTSVLEELSQHLDDRYRSLIARGLDAAEADASVLRELDADETLQNASRATDALTRELRHLERRRTPAVVPGRAGPTGRCRDVGARLALRRPRAAQEPDASPPLPSSPSRSASASTPPSSPS